jgi:hypothetical protein
MGTLEGGGVMTRSKADKARVTHRRLFDRQLLSNKHEVRATISAAQKAAASNEALPLDDEVRKLVNRGWLRNGLVVDPIRFSRDSLVMAVERGRAEQQVASSQGNALAQWRSLSDAAKKAAMSLDSLTRLSKFKIGDLQVLCTKQNLAMADFSESITATLRAVQSEAHSAAAQLHSSIIAARKAAHTIADQANAMAQGLAKLKHDPGAPFRRGFAIEMMKTWWLLTDRFPSPKRSEVGNPFVAFADAGLQSISPDSDSQSCSGVVRSALPLFRELHDRRAFDSVLDEITHDQG